MIFVDSSYLLALMNSADPNCEEAHDLLAFQAPREIWITTHLQIGRLWEGLAEHIDAIQRRRVLATIAAARQLKILPISTAQQAEANALLADIFEPPGSYADATTLLVARGLGIDRILSFADGFDRFGLTRERS